MTTYWLWAGCTVTMALLYTAFCWAMRAYGFFEPPRYLVGLTAGLLWDVGAWFWLTRQGA